MGLEEASRITVIETPGAMDGHIPTWFPPTFGLAGAWTISSSALHQSWATWSDRDCREVSVYFSLNGRGPTSWAVQYDKPRACGNGVMGMGECIGYRIGPSSGGSISVQTIGLARVDADRLVHSIPT